MLNVFTAQPSNFDDFDLQVNIFFILSSGAIFKIELQNHF